MAIAAAARAEFSERGYSGATVRSIAARAHVDPALIHHYFGTKAELFQAVLVLGFDPARAALPQMLAGPREEAGARIVRTFLSLYEDPQFREPIVALMRTAMTDPEVASIAATFLQGSMLPQVATVATGPDAHRRVALAMTHLMGLVLGRHVIGLDVLQVPIEDLVAEVGPVVQRYLDGTQR
jgi:AcrR family transcriptional regulator